MSTAFAEIGENGLVLDSVITTWQDGTRTDKTVYEYNSNKQVTVINEFEYDDVLAILTSRSINTYNENDQKVKQESYELMDGELVLNEITEYSNWDATTNEPGLIITYSRDPENPEAGIILNAKQEFFFDNEGIPTDYHIYEWDDENEEWSLSARGNMSYDEQGLLSGLYLTASLYDGLINIESTSTYEYDSNKHVTKETISQNINGEPYKTSVRSYLNEYYDDGNLKTVTETTEGSSLLTIEHYFWGELNATRINSIKSALRRAGIYFDLSGRAYNGTPTEPGIYIIDNRKVVIE